MSNSLKQREPHPSVEFHLLGCVDFDACLALQHRLVYESGGRADGRIVVLLCEHTDLITVGRSGSWGHIRLDGRALTSRQLSVRWIRRGGGCVLHAPGQLAVYPIVPLDALGWTTGRYMRALHGGLATALGDLGIRCETRPGRFGIWGRTGPLVAVGAAVRNAVAFHGAFVNVNPAMQPYRFIDTMAGGATAHRQKSRREKTAMSCLLAERGRAVTMTKVRSRVIPALATALGCHRYHLHTGHPLLREHVRRLHDPIARAS